MKFRLLLSLLLLPLFVFPEGSKEVWRNLPNHTTWLYLCNDLTNHCQGFGGDPRSNFAVYGCEPDERLYFIAENSDEVVYIGFQGDPDQAGWHIAYRIKDEFGTIVQAEANLPTAGTGFINNIGEARIGPTQIYGAGGYDALLFTPPAAGEYFIEFSLQNSFGSPISESFYMNLFDVTVYNSVAAEVKPGRLYSKSWQFIDGEGGFGGWDR